MTKNPASSSSARPWLSTRDMAFVSLFAVLVGIGAQIRILLPFSPVPLTLQTAMVFAAGLMLGSRRGGLSLFLYMIMGLLGLPVFTQGGGLQNVLVPSFGFIVGFIPAAWLIGRIMETPLSRLGDTTEKPALTFVKRIAAGVAGYLTYNVVGVLWLHMNINFIMGKSVTLGQSLAMGLFPFVLPDLLKLVAVVLLVTIISARLGNLSTDR